MLLKQKEDNFYYLKGIPKRKNNNKKTKVSIVIPNWNGKEFLKKCLPSIKKQSFKGFEVIIIDNGSTDGSLEYIRRYYTSYKVISLKENIGFAPAVNLGIIEACGDYIILINNDTELDAECIKNLVKAADLYPEVGMVAAKMVQFYNRNLIDSAGDYIDAVGHADNIGRGEINDDRYKKSDYVFLVTGGGGLIKREVFERIGILDPDYFAYFEDVDLCFRAQLVGFKGWFESTAIIYHIHKATSNKNRLLTEYLQFRNMTMTIIKNYPKSLLLHQFNWVKIILVNLNTVRFLYSEGYLKAGLKAELYIFLNLFKILKKRAIIQSHKKVCDSYIIDNVKEKKITFFGLFKDGL